QCAPSPDLAVTQLAGPRVELPFGGIGEHRVRMREEREPGAVAAARDAGDEVRAFRDLGVQLAGDAVGLEVAAQVSFPGGLTVSRRINSERSVATSSRSETVALSGESRTRAPTRARARAR